jgi:hypothetical protein
VVVAARLSLSFPLLLSAVRLYELARTQTAVDSPLEPVECWFTDGGAASNFPIHFFDSWFPGRPTLGLDLQGYRPGEPRVYVPGPADPVPPRFRSVTSVAGFAAALVDAVRNWRDTMQSELPGVRERVCHIRLSPTEGGLNLNMSPQVIADLVARGADAGEALRTTFSFDQHRFTRFLTLMEALEQNLRASAPAFAAWSPTLAAGAFGGHPFGAGHPPAWCATAAAQTTALYASVGPWAFDIGYEPQPEPEMRITPRI